MAFKRTRAEGPEWEAVLQAVINGENPPCPECGRPLKIRRDLAPGETKPIGHEAICAWCEKSIGD